MKFRNDRHRDFHRLVRARVRAHFAARGVDKYANRELALKSAVFLAVMVGSYWLVLSNRLSGLTLLGAAIAFGLSSLLLAFNLAHDAAHNALVRNRRLNAVIYALTFNLQGTNAYLWKLRHIGSHHVFPNVDGGDADMDDNRLVRLSPWAPQRPAYRFQHCYAPALYLLVSLHWVLVYDFQMLFKKDLANMRDMAHPPRKVAGLLFAKLAYFTLTLALPMVVLDIPWWQVVVGFFLMHVAMSALFIFPLICTHFAEEAGFPELEGGHLEGSWASHQLDTSLDYNTNSRLANFLLGGFNAHAAHHLFPDVCHVHYIAISRIIKDTARECGLSHHELSYPAAIRSHFRYLKRLGREPRRLPRAEVIEMAGRTA